jgi:hypothetical protein
MRRTTTAAVAATAFLLAGCGATHPGGPGATGSTGSTPVAGGTSSNRSCTAEAVLTAADTGRTLCVTAGGTIRVTLDGTPDRPWSPVTADGGALTPINAGIGAPRGDTIAAYRATAPGTARLTSSQPLCASPTAPGQVACLGLREWTVTVRVANG